MTELWFDKPNLKEIEPLIEGVIPVAVQTLGGLCEADPRPHVFQVALPALLDNELGGTSYVTALAAVSSDEVYHIGSGSPLVSEFAQKFLEESSIEILRVRLERSSPPQRLLEKFAATVDVRPSRLQVASVSPMERVWVHSVFLLGLESIDQGLSLRHFLQDSRGRFLPRPETWLNRLDDQALFARMEKLSKMPQNHAVHWENRLSEATLAEEFHSLVAGLQCDELAKAETYYTQLEQDLNRRIGTLTKQGTKSTLEEKKERVRAERQIRLASIVDRYRSQIVVQPVGARILLLPTFHCRFVSAVSPSAVLEASFCPMLKEFLPVDCPNCTALAKSFTLSAGKYGCPSCGQ